MLESGKLVHKIGFDIDSKSWNNLNKFQKRISMLKKQMKGLNGAVNLKVNVNGFKQQAKKVAKIKQEAENAVAKTTPAKTVNKGAEIRAKRRRRIENLSEQLGYRMKKGGVSMDAMNSFGKGTFLNASKAFMRTGDIQTFNTQVGLASRRMIDASKSARTMKRGVHDLRSTMVAATQAYTAFAGLQHIGLEGMKLESLRAGMKIFAGDDKGIASEFKYIKDVSDRLGLSLAGTAEQYTKFSIVSRNKLSSEDRKGLFEGFSEYATVLQVSPERFQRGMMAIQQMLSKSKVSSEELRLQ